MRTLEHLLIGWQGQLHLDQVFGLFLVRSEGGEQEVGVRVLEVVGRLLFLVLQVDVAIAHAVGPLQFIDVVHPLQVHRQAFQPVGNLPGDRLAVDASDLLEIGELCHLHAVEPDLPAQTPGAQRRVFPVVLDKADVVLFQVKTQCFQRA